MTKPLIGVTMARERSGGFWRDSLRENYVTALTRFGAMVIPLPNVVDSTQWMAQLDGLLLTGGGDYDPVLFHQPDEGTDWSNWCEARDLTELRLMAEADRRGLPMFGICRGVQSLAVGFGGTIIQDIARKMPDSPIRHSQHQARQNVSHPVRVTAGTRLKTIVKTEDLHVNSFHHQSVDQVPPGWQVAAMAPDGVVEALERPGDVFMLGVQWHPEDLAAHDEVHACLFKAFVLAAETLRKVRQ